MTPENPIPEELLRFIDANVESVEQLEILRILGEAPAKQWNACDLARDSQIHPSSIAAQLAALESRGLLKTEMPDGQLVCAYGPKTAQLKGSLTQLLQFYKERPVTLIKVVYARADHRLNAFAEAFRLRKEG